MRGQAFVVCSDESEATKAINSLRGYMFYGKPLRLNYSRKVSDVIAKVKGTFDESVKIKREQLRQQSLKDREVKAKRKLIQRLMMLK